MEVNNDDEAMVCSSPIVPGPHLPLGYITLIFTLNTFY